MEVMLDLETLSTRPYAVILTIGAVKFNRNNETIPLDKMDSFYRRIDINSCNDLGMHTDEMTVQWWKRQNSVIYEEAFGKERVSLANALDDFTKWLQGSELIWSHGASFDIPIMDEAYKRCGKTTPWKFWNVRDTRTLYDIAGIKGWDLPKDNVHHALHDCWRQISGVKQSIKLMKNEQN